MFSLNWDDPFDLEVTLKSQAAIVEEGLKECYGESMRFV